MREAGEQNGVYIRPVLTWGDRAPRVPVAVRVRYQSRQGHRYMLSEVLGTPSSLDLLGVLPVA